MDKPLKATRHCRHYDYVRSPDKEKDGPQCACGIDLREKPGATQPCMPPNVVFDRNAPQPEPCVWREEFTDAERDAWERYRVESLARAAVVMEKIPGSADRKHRNTWGTTGQLDCPACGTGIVRWSRSRVNGHLFAGCSTPNCFAVMQ